MKWTSTSRARPPTSAQNLSLEQRLRILLRQRPTAAARILADALTHEHGPDALPLARAALRNAQPAAVAAVVQQLHRLPALDRRLPSISLLHLSDALRRVLSRRSARASLNAIEVISARADPALAHLLPPLLHLLHPDVPDAAAAALLRLSVLTLGSHGRRTIAPAQQRDLLDEAVAQAAASFRSHRRPDALLAAALSLSRPGPRLAALLEERDSAGAISMRAVPGWLDQPLVVANLPRWLGNATVRRAVTNWLPRLPKEDLPTFLRDGHLLRTPDRRAALRQVSPALACAPRPEAMADLPPGTQSQVPMLLHQLNLSPRSRVERLSACAALPSPVARWRALEALSLEPPSRAGAPVRTFCSDEEPALARLAVLRLRQWDELKPADEEALAAAGHSSISEKLANRRARRAVLLLRDRFTEIAQPARLAAGRRLLSSDRGALVTVLHEMILDDRRPRRQIESMLLGRRLSLMGAMEQALIDLTSGADVQVAATAVACLGMGRSRRALEALRGALRHPNHRMVANALEALSGVAPREAVEASHTFRQSPANRVRGNAVRLILMDDPAAGAAELRTMLRDRWPLHQISAIWVARRSRTPVVIDELRRMSRDRQHPEVQLRAAGVLRFLESAGPTPPPGNRVGSADALAGDRSGERALASGGQSR